MYSPGQPWTNNQIRQRYRGTLYAGPIAWPSIRLLASDSGVRGPPAPSSYAPRHGLAFANKNLAVVDFGAVVRVRIPASERGRLSLDYTYIQPRDSAGRHRVADGASQVTFKACAPGSNAGDTLSLFDGGFIVAGAQCALVDIYTSASSQPLRRQIPFGVPGRSCPATG